MAEQVWYVRDKGRVMGPFTSTQFEKLRGAGRINRLSEISNDGSNWSGADSLFVSSKTNTQAEQPRSVTTSTAPPQPSWYYVMGDNRVGPLPLSELGQLFAIGKLEPATPVWNDSMPDWKPAKNVPELMGYLSTQQGQHSSNSAGFTEVEESDGLGERRSRKRTRRNRLIDMYFHRFHMGWIVPTLWIVNLVILLLFLVFMLGSAFFPRAVDGFFKDFAESFESMSFETRRVLASIVLILFACYLGLNVRARLENFYLHLAIARKIKAINEYDEIPD